MRVHVPRSAAYIDLTVVSHVTAVHVLRGGEPMFRLSPDEADALADALMRCAKQTREAAP